jgi:hypothetical protein
MTSLQEGFFIGALFGPAGDHEGRIWADWRDLHHGIAPRADWQAFGGDGGEV